MVATLDFCTVETLADFVTRLRARRPRSRIAGVARVSEDLILRIEKGLTLNPRYETIERLAPALGTTVDEMLARIVAGATTTPLPDDVEPAPEYALPIPEWDAEIAAGDWMDASTCQLDDQMHRDIIARGLFIVRVRGDSMLPTYKPGDRVMFQVIRLDEGGPVEGRDYYWQASDGRCTLKTCHEVQEDAYILAPLNRKKYKTKLILPKQELARLAIVVSPLAKPRWEV